MEKKFCHSCGMPLDLPDAKGVSDKYCAFCADEKGELRSREVIQEALAGWFISWQPGLDKEKAEKRADLYLQSMPAWAE